MARSQKSELALPFHRVCLGGDTSCVCTPCIGIQPFLARRIAAAATSRSIRESLGGPEGPDRQTAHMQASRQTTKIDQRDPGALSNTSLAGRRKAACSCSRARSATQISGDPTARRNMHRARCENGRVWMQNAECSRPRGCHLKYERLLSALAALAAQKGWLQIPTTCDGNGRLANLACIVTAGALAGDEKPHGCSSPALASVSGGSSRCRP